MPQAAHVLSSTAPDTSTFVNPPFTLLQVPNPKLTPFFFNFYCIHLFHHQTTSGHGYSLLSVEVFSPFQHAFSALAIVAACVLYQSLQPSVQNTLALLRIGACLQSALTLQCLHSGSSQVHQHWMYTNNSVLECPLMQPQDIVEQHTRGQIGSTVVFGHKLQLCSRHCLSNLWLGFLNQLIFTAFTAAISCLFPFSVSSLLLRLGR